MRASERASEQRYRNQATTHDITKCVVFSGVKQKYRWPKQASCHGCSCSDFDARMFKVHPFGASRQFACESIFTPSSVRLHTGPILWYHSYHHRAHRNVDGGSDQSSAPLSNSHEYFRVNQRRRRRRRFYYGKCFVRVALVKAPLRVAKIRAEV